MKNKFVWNVYAEDINAKEIKIYNIFDHSSFRKDCVKVLDEVFSKDDYNIEDLKSKILKEVMYYFWAKAEWEVLIVDWTDCPNNIEKKVSVYDQVLLNFDAFLNYICTQYFMN
jgi:hypothetical protein